TPAGASGPTDIVVTSSSHGSVSCTGCFTYYAPMVVAEINPMSGPFPGGTTVSITGTGFVDVTSVTVGGRALLSLVVASSTLITGKTGGAADSGIASVVVNSSHGSGTCTNCFTYSRYPGGTWTSLTAVGTYHVCALAQSAAYCWGYNNNGQRGPNGSSAPVAVHGGIPFVSLTAGEGHTCGLT